MKFKMQDKQKQLVPGVVKATARSGKSVLLLRRHSIKYKGYK